MFWEGKPTGKHLHSTNGDSSGKNACFAIWLHVGTKFFNLSHHFLSMDGWPGDAFFFPVGPTFEDHPQVFSQEKVQPLGIYFWHLRLGLFKSSFLVGEAEHMWLYPFCKDKCIFTKNISFVIWARVDTKFLNSSHHVLSVDDRPGDAFFFPVGPTFEDHPQVFSQEKVQPLGIYFWHLRLGLFKSSFLVGEAEHMWLYPFCKDKCIFRKKHVFCHLGALTQNSWIRPIMSYLWMTGLVTRFFSLWGQPLKIIRKYSAKKRSSPLEFIFDTCASASSSHLFWLVKLNICGCTPFARTNVFSEKKHVFCNLGACWHKILEFVPSCPICGWLAWWCDFFPVGPTFEDYTPGNKRVSG